MIHRHSPCAYVLLFSICIFGTFVNSCSLAMSPESSLRVHVRILDVGNGLCVLIQSDQHTVLFDVGDIDSAVSTIAALRMYGVEELDAVIISHPHSDHAGALLPILSAFDFNGPLYYSQPLAPELYAGMSTVKQVQLIELHNAMHLTFDQFALQILWPPEISTPKTTIDSANYYSIAMRLQVDRQGAWGDGSCDMVLFSDTDTAAQRRFVPQIDRRTGAALVPHHGAANAFFQPLYTRLAPEFALISVGKDNAYDHPAPDLISFLHSQAITVLQSAELGNIELQGNGLYWSFVQSRSMAQMGMQN